MKGPLIIDRATRKIVRENVWGGTFLSLLYTKHGPLTTFLQACIRWVIQAPWVSKLVGCWYSRPASCRFIAPFCQRFHIDLSESPTPIESFTSFNDFFQRQLLPETRPFPEDPQAVAAPADGRYSFVPLHSSATNLPVKTTSLSLAQVLQSDALARPFEGGLAVICRLCPADCHRFYFPTTGYAHTPCTIHGPLLSVNPVALQRFPWIYWVNKRTYTVVDSQHLGSYLFIEVGATNCGSIQQTFPVNSSVQRGQEKGLFQLGGSTVILIFAPNTFSLAQDLIDISAAGHEVYCKRGSLLGMPSSSFKISQ